MTSTFMYRAFGLNFESELPLPELEAADGTPDVFIGKGSVPDPDVGGRTIGEHLQYQVEPERFLLKVEGVAGYEVAGGCRIVVEAAAPGVSAGDIRLYLLGSVFSALLHQRGLLVLHGSAVEAGGKAVIFSGTSGAGKSTTAAAFHNKGYAMVTDDVCAVQFRADGTPEVVPGFPQLKLWADSMDKLNVDKGSAAHVARGLDKYGFKVGGRHCRQPLPLEQMFILNPGNDGNCSIRELRRFEKIEALIQNTYRIQFLDVRKGKLLHLQQCAALSSQVALYQVIRSKERFAVDEVVALLETQIKRAEEASDGRQDVRRHS